jgi:Tfp pilus assembly protein FimT
MNLHGFTLVEVLVLLTIGGMLVGLVAVSARGDWTVASDSVADQLRDLRTRAVRSGEAGHVKVGGHSRVTCRPNGMCFPDRITTAEGEWRVDLWTGEVRRAR